MIGDCCNASVDSIIESRELIQVAMQDAYYGSVGSLPFDDDLFYALDTTGKVRVQTAPTAANEVARLSDVQNPTSFAIPLVSSLPVASVTYRGRLVRLAGAAGVADKAYVCFKDASDAYVWMQLVVVP